MTEFRPARPSSFEICEYSEKLMASDRSRMVNVYRDDDFSDDDDDSDADHAPSMPYKPGTYSSYKKGV